MVVDAPALEAVAGAQARAVNRCLGVVSGQRVDAIWRWVTLLLDVPDELNYSFRLTAVGQCSAAYTGLARTCESTFVFDAAGAL